MPTIVLAALKGGVGKTTTAIGLSAAATNRGLAAHVVDLDPQGGALDWASLAEVNGAECPDVRDASSLRADVDDDAWVFIDTPPAPSPSRAVKDALKGADLIVVPLGSSPAEVVRVFPTVDVVQEHSDAPVVCLLTRVRVQTRAVDEARALLIEQGYVVLDHVVPLREIIYQALGGTPPALMTEIYSDVLDDLVATLNTRKAMA